MAKKKIKETKVINQAPTSIKGMRKLEIGEKILYRTSDLIDKAEVISIDKDNKTAKLSNQIIVSLGVDELGNVLKIGSTDITCRMKVWDASCDRELEYFLSRRYIKEAMDKINKAYVGKEMDKDPDKWTQFSKRLKKNFEKCGL